MFTLTGVTGSRGELVRRGEFALAAEGARMAVTGRQRPLELRDRRRELT
jgi:hypothetical protein